MGFGGNGVSACPPAHRPRQLQSVSLSPLIKYRATNYFPLMFLLNMGGHNYCSFHPSQSGTLLLEGHTHTHTHTYCTHTGLKYTPATGSLGLLHHSYAHLTWTLMERHDENDKEMLFRQLLHVDRDRQTTSGTEGDCISCLTTSGENSQSLSFHPMEGKVDDSGRG